MHRSVEQQGLPAWELCIDTSYRLVFNEIFGPYEHPHSMLQNKMAKAKLGLEIYVLTTIPE